MLRWCGTPPPRHPADAGAARPPPPAPAHLPFGALVLPQLSQHPGLQVTPHGSAPHDPVPAAWQPRAEPVPMAAAPAARNSSAELRAEKATRGVGEARRQRSRGQCGPPQAGSRGPKGGGGVARGKGTTWKGGGAGRPAARCPRAAVYLPQHPEDAGAPRPPPPLDAHLQHQPRFWGPWSPLSLPSSPPAKPPFTAAPRTTPLPRHGSRGRSRRGWLPPRRHAARAQSRRGWVSRRRRGSRRQTLHGRQSGPRAPAKALDQLVRDWDAVSDPLRGRIFPLVLQVYEWLNRATSSGTGRSTPCSSGRTG